PHPPSPTGKALRRIRPQCGHDRYGTRNTRSKSRPSPTRAPPARPTKQRVRQRGHRTGHSQTRSHVPTGEPRKRHASTLRRRHRAGRQHSPPSHETYACRLAAPQEPHPSTLRRRHRAGRQHFPPSREACACKLVGLREWRTLAVRGCRRARGTAAPVITLFGIDAAVLLSGAVITETVFNLPGIGKLAVDSVTNADLPMLMGVTLVAATAMIVANIVVDACYALIDPRVRTS
ncbi:ABC transporter permease, partial [Actinomadura sp. BRA 177]|nr:ABC transporter permease [Actinomadura sp. BRA 177]